MKNTEVEQQHMKLQDDFNRVFAKNLPAEAQDFKFVAVSYLSSDEEFEKGDVSDSFVAKLHEAWGNGIILCSAGIHICEFCDSEEEKGMSSSEKVLFDKVNNIKYIFPQLIFHYIEKHNFKPSDAFIKFIMEVKQ